MQIAGITVALAGKLLATTPLYESLIKFFARFSRFGVPLNPKVPTVSNRLNNTVWCRSSSYESGRKIVYGLVVPRNHINPIAQLKTQKTAHKGDGMQSWRNRRAVKVTATKLAFYVLMQAAAIMNI